MVPSRQIRAVYDEESVTVYQAYSPEIAGPAVEAQRFVPPFSRTRMTWIKPSFLWMAYRCGWASKPGQEWVLAIRVTRSGFESALAQSCLSHFGEGVYASREAWEARRDASPVRIQWDPERDLHHAPTGVRSIQIGIGGSAVAQYVDDWTVAIDDVTDLFKDVGAHVARGELDEATRLLPGERVFPLSEELAATVGA